MEIKLIAMDMDGTLLTSEDKISDRTIQTLKQVQAMGITLVLASGRSYRKLMKYAETLEMNKYNGYLIEVNGIAVYDLANDKRQVFEQLKQAQIHHIFSVLKPLDVEILGLTDDGIRYYIPESMMADKRAYRKANQLPEDYPWCAGAFAFITDNRIGYPKQYQIQEVSQLPKTLNKIAVAHHPDDLMLVYPLIKEKLGEHYWLGLTSPGWLEIMPKHINKGNALLNLGEQLQIKPSQMMAFGDGENDIEMLEAVKYGMVMNNALDTVKKIGYAICEDNNHDGIAKTIDSYIIEANKVQF